MSKATIPATMNLTVLNDGNHWLEAHRTGCQHLSRNAAHKHNVKHGLVWTEDHATLTSAAESFASDFIAEGSMTVEDALASIHFAPCVKLPLGDAPATEMAGTLRYGRIAEDGTRKPQGDGVNRLSDLAWCFAKVPTAKLRKQLAKAGIDPSTAGWTFTLANGTTIGAW